MPPFSSEKAFLCYICWQPEQVAKCLCTHFADGQPREVFRLVSGAQVTPMWLKAQFFLTKKKTRKLNSFLSRTS